MDKTEIYRKKLNKSWLYQFTVALEEASEYTKAITKVIRYGFTVKNINQLAEEIADLEITKEQIIFHIVENQGIKDFEDQIQINKDKKIARLRREIKHYEVMNGENN